MKLSLRLLLLLPFIFVMVGCPDDDIPETVEARPYAEVYAEDKAEIEDFMATHFMTVDADFNVTYTKITGSTPGTPISSRTDLEFKTISKGGVDHKLYFIKLNEGVGSNPTVLDSVFSSYKGHKTDLSVFDSASSPVWFQLQQVIQGWQEIFPEFKTGNSVTDPLTGVTTYSDFGAGVMFVPSALGYYNQAVGNIGSYTPLIFNFKLMKLKYKDHDGDKILSKDEYGGPTSGTALDSDGDGKPDYGDFDDDNDGFLTKNEIKKPVITPGVHPGWYAFDAPELNCTFGNGKKKHLNPNTGCN
jgi:hypothetical protein